MTKKTTHPDILDEVAMNEEIEQQPATEQPKARKPRREETDEERSLRLAKYAERREIEAYREMRAPERRRVQAAALWRMYRAGELVRQTISIGTMKQEMLYSHVSIFADEYANR